MHIGFIKRICIDGSSSRFLDAKPSVLLTLHNLIVAGNISTKDTHHDEVPHASSFRHQRGDAAAAGHQDDLNGLGVQKVIQQLGGFSWVTLEGQNDKVLHRQGDEKMDASINNEEEK